MDRVSQLPGSSHRAWPPGPAACLVRHLLAEQDTARPGSPALGSPWLRWLRCPHDHARPTFQGRPSPGRCPVRWHSTETSCAQGKLTGSRQAGSAEGLKAKASGLVAKCPGSRSPGEADGDCPAPCWSAPTRPAWAPQSTHCQPHRTLALGPQGKVQSQQQPRLRSPAMRPREHYEARGHRPGWSYGATQKRL